MKSIKIFIIVIISLVIFNTSNTLVSTAETISISIEEYKEARESINRVKVPQTIAELKELSSQILSDNGYVNDNKKSSQEDKYEIFNQDFPEYTEKDQAFIKNEFKKSDEDTNQKSITFNFDPITDNLTNYTYDVINGGVYKLKNRKTGKYFDVTNSATSNHSNIGVNSSNSATNQQFKIKYVGVNSYELIPMHTTGMTIDMPYTSENGSLKIGTKDFTSSQGFTISTNDGNYYKISTNKSGNSKYLINSYRIKWSWFRRVFEAQTDVIQASLNNIDARATGVEDWKLERVGTEQDLSEAFYIRNVSTGKFMSTISTSNGSIMKATDFQGTETQQFKKELVSSTLGYRYYPANRQDKVLRNDYMNSITEIKIAQKESTAYECYTQKNKGTSINGYTQYRIKCSSSLYLGSLNIDSSNNIIVGNNHSDYWEFIPVEVYDYETENIEEIKDITNTTELNSKKVDRQARPFAFIQTLSFIPETDKIYQITSNINNSVAYGSVFTGILNNDNNAFYEIVDYGANSSGSSSFYNVKFEPGKVYEIVSLCLTGNANYTVFIDDDYTNVSKACLSFDANNEKVSVNGDNAIADEVWGNSVIRSIMDKIASGIPLSKTLMKVSFILDIADYLIDTNYIDLQDITYSGSAESLNIINNPHPINDTVIEYYQIGDPSSDPGFSVSNNKTYFPSYNMSIATSITNHCATAAGANIMGYYDVLFPNMYQGIETYDINSSGDFSNYFSSLSVPLSNSIVDTMVDLYDEMNTNNWTISVVSALLDIIYPLEYLIASQFINMDSTLKNLLNDLLDLFNAGINIDEIGGSLPSLASYGLRNYISQKGYTFESHIINLSNYTDNYNTAKSYIQSNIPVLITFNNNYHIWRNSTNLKKEKGIESAHTMVVIGCKKVSKNGSTYIFYKVANSWGGYSYVRADKGWISGLVGIAPAS